MRRRDTISPLLPISSSSGGSSQSRQLNRGMGRFSQPCRLNCGTASAKVVVIFFLSAVFIQYAHQRVFYLHVTENRHNHSDIPKEEVLDAISKMPPSNESQIISSPTMSTPTHHEADDVKAKVCHDIKSLLDVSQWPDIVFFEDQIQPTDQDPNSEENVSARATVAEFNRIRNKVLTTDLLDEGINEGDLYAAQSFAQRFLEKGNDGHPLSIAVTGNSFTIGSNCGENTRQPSDVCAWPSRLARRWTELVASTFGNMTNTKIEWHMLQTNAQSSNNVAQRLPSLIEEFHSKNKRLDVILLNNGITDSNQQLQKPWYEAVIRVLLEQFPQIMIISLADGTFLQSDHSPFYPIYTTTQDHYHLTRVDIAKMCQLLRDSDKESYSSLRQHYPESSLLWPQVPEMMYANGTIAVDENDPVGVGDPRPNGIPVYWANYTPLVEKTKCAWFPTNHPPWTTHQYVADSVLYSLLRVLKTGMGCDDSGMRGEIVAKPFLPEATVADKAEIEGCPVCLKPRERLDAKFIQAVVNGTNNDELGTRESPVVVTCGDWVWVTDERKRSGWQSDQAGSLIRFRLKVSDSEVPTISLTYMRSHATFGDFRVTFETISKGNISDPLMTCSDVAKFGNRTLLPSVTLEGKMKSFSLWDTFIFSGNLDSFDDIANEVMKKTVADKMRETKDIEYVDMYVLNENDARVKIQTVTSC